jgi:hypothetical protein
MPDPPAAPTTRELGWFSIRFSSLLTSAGSLIGVAVPPVVGADVTTVGVAGSGVIGVTVTQILLVPDTKQLEVISIAPKEKNQIKTRLQMLFIAFLYLFALASVFYTISSSMTVKREKIVVLAELYAGMSDNPATSLLLRNKDFMIWAMAISASRLVASVDIELEPDNMIKMTLEVRHRGKVRWDFARFEHMLSAKVTNVSVVVRH